MPTDVIMPKLGESITEGTILEWKKNVGDSISRDETILEISTDKVDSEVPAPASGILLEILYQKNDTVAVGEVIARIGESGEKIEPKEIKDSTETNIDVKQESVEEVPVKEEVKKTIQKSSNRKFYSPLVKSIAQKEGIELSELDLISGSGHNGRVNKKDILDYIHSRITSSISKVPVTADTVSYSLEDKVEPMGHVRKMIAQHMIKSRDTSVHVYSSNEVDMTKIVEFRANYKETFKTKYQTPLTYTPFITDATIRAIHEFPLINCSIQGDNIKHNQNINMGIAVALPDNNLIVPVIKRSEELNFLGLARSTADLALRARESKLQPEEAQGSTFTITNPGIFGSLFGMGIINQPNVAILSVGSIHKRPVVKETEYGDVVVVRSMMYLTLAYDHRVIDGAYGTQFLAKLKDLLENFSDNEVKI
jgi:2-oxoglutarate dehydrogenase E2 component (dihydrolipoamide succinyltransferase)